MTTTPDLTDQLIARPSLHEQVIVKVRDMIVTGRIKPGERVPELQIAKALGISRTPLREALKVLASEGLVNLLPLRGAVVTSFTVKDAQDMLTLIGLLEGYAGRLACEASDAEIDEIHALHEQMRQHFNRRERIEYFKVNHSVHMAIIAAAHNDTLEMLYGILRTRTQRIRFLGNLTDENWACAWQEHEDMIRALVAREGEKLAEIISAHWVNTWPRISASITSLDQAI